MNNNSLFLLFNFSFRPKLLEELSKSDKPVTQKLSTETGTIIIIHVFVVARSPFVLYQKTFNAIFSETRMLTSRKLKKFNLNFS